MSGMFSGCSSLESISVSDTFSQSVTGSFPEFAEEGFTGKWISSVDGIAYSSDGIPSNIAATYTAQVNPPSQKTKIDKKMFSVDVGSAVYTGFGGADNSLDQPKRPIPCLTDTA